MKCINVEEGEGKYKILLTATFTGQGVLVNLLGGETPHLGAVVISLPRPGLKDPEEISSTTSLLPLPGHKDDQAARPVAEMLVRETGQPVSVAAGIHVDNATAEDIQILLDNVSKATLKLLMLFKTK